MRQVTWELSSILPRQSKGCRYLDSPFLGLGVYSEAELALSIYHVHQEWQDMYVIPSLEG